MSILHYLTSETDNTHFFKKQQQHEMFWQWLCYNSIKGTKIGLPATKISKSYL